MNASTFTWLDYAEQDRQRMLDVIQLLGKEQDTRDELGIGTIRDALADLLFPGTSTIQTRLRYFLFVPWMYLDFENKRTKSSDIARRAREAEIALIYPLRQNNEEGIFGRDAGARLQRLPSSVYWYGLRRWGICLYSRSQVDYHRSLDGYYHRLSANSEHDEAESRPTNWHAGLPKPPADFPNNVSFDLTQAEAEYLRERIIVSARGSALAFLASEAVETTEIEFVWCHPLAPHMPDALRSWIEHARNFSESMHGAALLYNLLLAEATRVDERIEYYRLRIRNWVTAMELRSVDLSTWDRKSFWTIVLHENQHVPYPTRDFVDAWLDLVHPPAVTTIVDHRDARRLIAERERRLKGGRARLHNQRALELWSGAAGVTRLDFRWSTVAILLHDLAAGLNSEAPNA